MGRLTEDVKIRLQSREGDWLVNVGDRQSFARYFAKLLQDKGVTKRQLADMMAGDIFNTSGTGAASQVRRLERWLSGATVPDDRGLLFRLCIMLGLTGEEARDLFARGLRVSWVHPADRDERIYEFCIDNGFDTGTTYRLINLDQQPLRPEPDVSAPATESVTKYLGAQYDIWKLRYEKSDKERKLSEFEVFLKVNGPYFHSVRQARRRMFADFVADFIEKGVEEPSDEGDMNGDALTVRRHGSYTLLADKLRAMRLPDSDILDGKQDDATAKRARKFQDDIKWGDSNPIRKDIPLYLDGKRDIPRDIFIKTYILSQDELDLYDLTRVLTEAGYPDLYVRAGDGFDALVFHLFAAHQGREGYKSGDYEKDYLDALKGLRKRVSALAARAEDDAQTPTGGCC